MEFFSFKTMFKQKEPESRTEPCPKCGTMDCVSKAEVGIQGAGQLYIVGGSNALAKTCKFRQQLRQARKIRLSHDKSR